MADQVVTAPTSLRTRPDDLPLARDLIAAFQQPGDDGLTSPAAIQADLGGARLAIASFRSLCSLTCRQR